MGLPKPRASTDEWLEVTGHDPRDRPFMLLAWQDAPDMGRVFLVPHMAVPSDWLDTIWMTHGVYLESEQERGNNDTVSAMVKLMALITWPKSERRPRRGRVRITHTKLEYGTRELAGQWNEFHVLSERFSRIPSCKIAMTVRTGRWPPASRTLDS